MAPVGPGAEGEPAGQGTRARILAATCILFLVVIWGLHRLTIGDVPADLRHSPWASLGLATAAVLLGISAVRGAVDLLAERSAAYLGVARARAARMLVSTVLYVILALVIIGQTQLDLTGIALSGAVTGVIVGIAAQASIANVIAGLVILFVRPFRTGQYVTVRAASFAGSEYSGEVGEITMFYTTIYCGPQEIRVPNSAMVTSVVTLRPQVLDVYVPVILPEARWEGFSTTSLAQQLTAALPPGRQVSVAVERVEGTAVQIGLHASVANEAERSQLERAALHALRPWRAAEATGPHPDGE